MSAAWWRVQHNKHHATPQKLDHDVDLNTLPLVAFHASIVTDTKFGQKMLKKSAFFRSFWLKYQKNLFSAIICPLVALSWQLILHPRYCLRTKRWLEMAFMGLRYVAWYWFFNCCLGWSVGFSLVVYVVYVWEVGSGLLTPSMDTISWHHPRDHVENKLTLRSSVRWAIRWVSVRWTRMHTHDIFSASGLDDHWRSCLLERHN